MALSSNSKRGLAIGALLPVLLSAYTESRKQAETRAQRTAAHLEERQQHREALQARDLDGAAKFLAQITADSSAATGSAAAGDFCAHVYMASELVRLSSYSTATRAAVIGALQYTRERPPATDPAAPVQARAFTDPQPRICECPAMLAQMKSNWRPSQIGTAATPAVIEEMTAKLDEVVSKCSVEIVRSTRAPASTPAPVMAAPPPPTPRPVSVGSSASTLLSDHSLLDRMASVVLGTSSSLPSSGAAEPAAATACAGEPAAANVTRLYIQIAREDQREAAVALQNALRAQGYAVPGIERVGNGAAPGSAQLRYVYAEDCASARQLVETLKEQPELADVALQPIPQYRGRSLRRSFELWFPK